MGNESFGRICYYVWPKVARLQGYKYFYTQHATMPWQPNGNLAQVKRSLKSTWESPPNDHMDPISLVNKPALLKSKAPTNTFIIYVCVYILVSILYLALKKSLVAGPLRRPPSHVEATHSPKGDRWVEVKK